MARRGALGRTHRGRASDRGGLRAVRTGGGGAGMAELPGRRALPASAFAGHARRSAAGPSRRGAFRGGSPDRPFETFGRIASRLHQSCDLRERAGAGCGRHARCVARAAATTSCSTYGRPEIRRFCGRSWSGNLPRCRRRLEWRAMQSFRPAPPRPQHPTGAELLRRAESPPPPQSR